MDNLGKFLGDSVSTLLGTQDFSMANPSADGGLGDLIIGKVCCAAAAASKGMTTCSSVFRIDAINSGSNGRTLGRGGPSISGGISNSVGGVGSFETARLVRSDPSDANFGLTFL